MTAAELKILRLRLKLTQSQMADRMGLSLRAYAEAETGDDLIRGTHRAAANWVALTEAAEQGDPMLCSDEARRAVKLVYEKMFGAATEA